MNTLRLIAYKVPFFLQKDSFEKNRPFKKNPII